MEKSPYPGYYKRIWLHAKLIILQTIVVIALFYRRAFGKHPRPTLRLSYPQSKLPSWRSPNTVEVYFPGSYFLLPGMQKKRPLYLDLHGGGFAIGEPSLDAHFCRYLADAADCIVISLPYRFGPYTRYPAQIHDLGALVACILTDERLENAVDTAKVAIGGFSSGGNLGTAVTLLPEMHGKIQSLVQVYPVLDFTFPIHEKLKLRPPGKDALTATAEMFIAGYILAKDDVKRNNPLLSPVYAKPEQLPENIYLVGAELDMLNPEAKFFHDKFSPFKKDMVYEVVEGALHGFTHHAERTRYPSRKARLEKMTSELYDRIATWLTTIVWMTAPPKKPAEQAVEELGEESILL